jgi:pheromone shutdown protein TraB
MDDTGRLVAMVLLASFAIERVVATVDFFMDGDALASPEKKKKLTLFSLSAVLGILVVWLTGIRILAALNFKTDASVDLLLTWMILVGGADKLGQLLGGGGSGGGGNSQPAREIPPIQIIVGDKETDVTVKGLPPGR